MEGGQKIKRKRNGEGETKIYSQTITFEKSEQEIPTSWEARKRIPSTQTRQMPTRCSKHHVREWPARSKVMPFIRSSRRLPIATLPLQPPRHPPVGSKRTARLYCASQQREAGRKPPAREAAGPRATMEALKRSVKNRPLKAR